MASGKFVDPLTLLRVAPVITSTAALWFSVDQYLFLHTFLAPQHLQKAKEIIPSYFRTFFSRGIIAIFTLYPLSIAAGILNSYVHPNDAYAWYVYGTGLATMHFAFVPLVLSPIRALQDDERKGHGDIDLREWLQAHAVRSAIADLPACICFVIAALKSLEARSP